MAAGTAPPANADPFARGPGAVGPGQRGPRQRRCPQQLEQSWRDAPTSSHVHRAAGPTPTHPRCRSLFRAFRRRQL